MFDKKKEVNEEDMDMKKQLTENDVKDSIQNNEKETQISEEKTTENSLDLMDPDELDEAAKKKKKKLPNWVILIVLAALIGATVIGSKLSAGSKAKKNNSNELSVIQVDTGNVKETINASGTVDSENKLIVYSPVNAKVTICNAKVGKAVKSGDKLIAFDTTTLEQDNQNSQLQLQANNQSNQEAYNAANKAAAAQIKASNEAAQAACDAANALADQVDAQGAVVDQAWADYNTAQAALTDAENNSLTDEQRNQLKADQEELYGIKDENGNVIAGKEGWKDEITGDYTEKYYLLDSDITAAQKALTEATEGGKVDEINAAKDANAKAIKAKADTDARIIALESEMAAILASISGPITDAQTMSDAAYAKTQVEQATYDAMYAQWQSAYSAAQTSNGDLDTSDTAVQASAKTQMEISSNAAELAAMTAAQLVEAGKAGLSAKFDGVISEVQAAAGTQATQGAPMYTLVDTNAMIVTLEVSTNDYGKYEVGKKASIKIGSNTYEGVVSNVNAMATNNAKGNPVVLVNIKINNADKNIVLGGSAKVTMTVAEAKNAICVPTEVINTSANGEFVYMIENGKVKKVPVTIGVTSDTKVEITDGLKKGDQVISDTTVDITEGMDATAASSSSSKK